ncbi:MAG: AAA family ATPase [Mycobacteriaceae bacterium]
MVASVVGRDEEIARINSFLDKVPSGGSALVLEGEAGIGKSTLWLKGIELARARGLKVLVARPSEAERSLAYVGLDDRLGASST